MDYKILLLSFACLLMGAGCWDRQELDELAIIGAIGFDTAEEGYEITLQVVNPEEVSIKKTGYDSPVTIFKGKGESVLEAIRNLTTQMPRKAYFSHLRMVVFSEDFAKNGLSDVIDFLLRDHEMRSDFYLIVSKETKAQDALEVLTSLETVPANKLFYSLQASEKFLGSTRAVGLNEVIAGLTKEGKEIVLTTLQVEGPLKKGKVPDNVKSTDEPVTLKYNGLAVFREDKLIGWLNEKDSESFNFITNKVYNTVLTIPCEDKSIEVEIFKTKTKLTGEVKENKPSTHVEVEVFGSIANVGCNVDLTNLEEFTKIEQKAGAILQENIESTIHKVQTGLNTDIFGFGEAIYQKDPVLWKEIKANWEQEFEQLPVQVDVAMHIKYKGTLRKYYQNDKRE